MSLAEFLDNEGKRSGVGKHRTEAETVCRSRLGINKEKIPREPEFVNSLRLPSLLSILYFTQTFFHRMGKLLSHT